MQCKVGSKLQEMWKQALVDFSGVDSCEDINALSALAASKKKEARNRMDTAFNRLILHTSICPACKPQSLGLVI
jgi:hypothetical protein